MLRGWPFSSFLLFHQFCSAHYDRNRAKCEETEHIYQKSMDGLDWISHPLRYVLGNQSEEASQNLCWRIYDRDTEFGQDNCLKALENAFGHYIFHKYYWGECKLKCSQEKFCKSRRYYSSTLCSFFTEIRLFLSELHYKSEELQRNRRISKHPKILRRFIREWISENRPEVPEETQLALICPTLYKNSQFSRLCRGKFSKSTRQIKHTSQDEPLC